MTKKTIIYLSYAGLLLLTSSIAFLYFTLFNYRASAQQWASASIMFAMGAVMLSIAEHKIENKK